MVSMAWIASVNTISLFQQIKCMDRRIFKKSVFSYDIDLIGKSRCHIQFLSLAYEEGVSGLNVVPAILQGLLGMCYTDLRSLRLACYQKHLENVSWLSKIQSLLTKSVPSSTESDPSYT